MSCEIIYNNKTYTEREFLNFVKGGGLEVVENISAKKAINKKVTDILNGTSYALHYFGNDIDSVASRKPTEEEVSEYQELLKNKDTKSDRFKELRKKLNQWQIIDGTMDNEQNSSLSDYIDMYNSIDEKTKQEEEVSQVTTSDYNILDKVDESTERGGFDPYASLSTPDVALAYSPPKNENRIQFSYLNIDTLATFFPNHSVVMLDKNGIEVPFESSKEIGTTYIFKGEEDFQVKVVDKARLEMEDKDFAKNAVGVKIKTGGVNAFRTVFKDGEPIPSDFEIKDFNRTVANSTKKGDELTLEVDPNDDYNKQLLDKLKRGEITENEASNRLNIIMLKDGVPIGNFTAIEDKPKDFDSLGKNKLIRDKALQQVKNSNKKITLIEKAKVATTLLGNPNTKLDNNGEIIENDINISNLDNIVSVGTMTDKVADGKHPKDTIFAYVNSMSTKNTGKKVPFIVIKYQNKNVAFPISIKTEKVDNSSKLIDIISSSLSPAQKSIKAIELLNSIKVDYSNINFSDPNWIHSEQTKELSEKLKTVVTPLIKIEDIKDKSQLVGNTTIGLDLENHSFFNNKILLELPDVQDEVKNAPKKAKNAPKKAKNAPKKAKKPVAKTISKEKVKTEEVIEESVEEETQVEEEVPKEEVEKVAKKLKQSKGDVSILTKEETELYTKETRVVNNTIEDLKKKEVKKPTEKKEKDISVNTKSYTMVNPYGFSQTIVYQNGGWGTINPKTKSFQKEYEKNQEYYEWLYQKSLTSFNKITEKEDGEYKREFQQIKELENTLTDQINNEDCNK